jgi:Predicted membrane protein
MQEKKSSLRKIVVTGVLGALSIALMLTPLGMIPWFGGISLTVVHVPVIIGAVVGGPVVGMGVGAIFGISALVKAAVAPPSPFDVFFVNPLISVLPRILIGLVAGLVYKAFRGRLSALAATLAGLAGSVTNSALVLGALVLFGAIPPAAALTVLASNSPIEAAVAAVLTLGVVEAWMGIESRSGKARLAEEVKE